MEETINDEQIGVTARRNICFKAVYPSSLCQDRSYDNLLIEIENAIDLRFNHSGDSIGIYTAFCHSLTIPESTHLFIGTCAVATPWREM